MSETFGIGCQVILPSRQSLNHLLLEQFLYCSLGYMSKMLVLYGQETYRLLLRWFICLLLNTVIY